MPIVEAPDDKAPLCQGDILQGIKLAVTQKPWEADAELVKAPAKFCMVLSRPCVLAHKDKMLVASVRKWPGSTPAELAEYEHVKQFLKEMRDGEDSPDVFYLGHIPRETGRFCAELDSIHTIELPKDVLIRQAFVTRSRIARLTPDFIRDLHVRIFRTFASLGFDDISWYSTDDLEWLEGKGKSEILKSQKAIQDTENKQNGLKAAGRQMSSQEAKELDASRAGLIVLSQEVQQLTEELKRRTTTLEIQPLTEMS